MEVKTAYPSCFVVDPKGRAGGLALLWDASLKLSIKSFSDSHIDAWIQGDNGVEWSGGSQDSMANGITLKGRNPRICPVFSIDKATNHGFVEVTSMSYFFILKREVEIENQIHF